MKKYIHFILLFGLLILVSCDSNSSDKINNDNKLESFDVENKQERIEVLSKQIKVYSEILDAEFSLFNANGFGNTIIFVPAASSWDYKMAIKIDKKNIGKWLKGMYETKKNPQDSVWINSILEKLDDKRKRNWQKSTKDAASTRFNTFYDNGQSKITIFYWAEEIIFQRIIQN